MYSLSLLSSFPHTIPLFFSLVPSDIIHTMVVLLFLILFLSVTSAEAHRRLRLEKAAIAQSTYSSYSHHTPTLQLTVDDHHKFRWSSEASIRTSAKGQHILHNYTVFVDDRGIQRSRWLKREFLPKILLKRYSSIDRTPRSWENSANNQARNSGCPVVIPVCFFDGVARDALRDSVNEGIKRWHDGLGEGRGVHLAITKSVLCFEKYDLLSAKYEPNPDFGPHVVIIKENIGNVMQSTVGYNPTIITSNLGLKSWQTFQRQHRGSGAAISQDILRMK